jgi:hypothetical protein
VAALTGVVPVLFSELWIDRKHNVSDTRPYPSSGERRKAPALLGPLERANLSNYPLIEASSPNSRRIRSVFTFSNSDAYLKNCL